MNRSALANPQSSETGGVMTYRVDSSRIDRRWHGVGAAVVRFLAVIACSVLTASSAADEAFPIPQWIWLRPDVRDGERASFRKEFVIDGAVRVAILRGAADNRMTIQCNGKLAADVQGYRTMQRVDVTQLLHGGSNVLTVEAVNDAGTAGVALLLDITTASGRQIIVSDASWQTTGDPTSAWRNAVSFGRLGVAPWGTPRGSEFTTSVGKSAPQSGKDYDQWSEAKRGVGATAAADINTMPGFVVRQVRSATADEGSWVSMCFDTQGRVLIAKEERGILRLTLSRDASESVRVETIDSTLKECRGLLHADGSLYAQCNKPSEGRPTGLYRLRDANGLDRFDEVKLLREFAGGGHGINDLALGPDGYLYLIQGDDAGMPREGPAPQSPVRQRHYDQLLDGLGAKNPESPNSRPYPGYLIRTDLEGKDWHVVACGLRNPYGIDFNRDGEAFTYDADMEWHTGLPWYRPTHVIHLTPGIDYGWRTGTNPWPFHYPERLPVTMEVGLGSPTAVKFGSKSNFPPKYRNALFILDWAYGRILAVHLTPKGASYTATSENFLDGRPLNVTDLDFGPDGAMYFVTGGRGTQSGLYRVGYVGADGHATMSNPSTEETRCATLRALRRRLESFQGRTDDQAIAFAWPHLGDADPWIRAAARLAIESQPVALWQDKALVESRPMTAATALLALVRTAPPSVQAALWERLNTLPFESFSDSEQLVLLRVYQLAILRLGRPTPSQSSAIVYRLADHYPCGSSILNREMSQLLVYFEEPMVVEKSMPLIAQAKTQEDQIFFLQVLRNVKAGWSEASTTAYFQTLADLRSRRGGREYARSLKQIIDDAMQRLDAGERLRIAKIIDSAVDQPWSKLPPVQRQFVRAWKLDDLESELPAVDRGRNFERGAALFAEASCIRCHQIGTAGGVIGPDLTSVSRRFSRKDILRSILEPSAAIDIKYRSTLIVTDEGTTLIGAVVSEDDDTLAVVIDPLIGSQHVVPKRSIAERKLTETSPMPNGALNTLSRDEIFDLIAYVESGGDMNYKSFRPQ